MASTTNVYGRLKAMTTIAFMSVGYPLLFERCVQSRPMSTQEMSTQDVIEYDAALFFSAYDHGPYRFFAVGRLDACSCGDVDGIGSIGGFGLHGAAGCAEGHDLQRQFPGIRRRGARGRPRALIPEQ